MTDSFHGAASACSWRAKGTCQYFGLSAKVVDVKKLRDAFYPPNDKEIKKFERAAGRWLLAVSKRDRALGRWAYEIAADEDLVGALWELVSWYKVSTKELLDFLTELRILYVPERELRARIRGLGRKWKEIETRARQARKESKDLLGDYNQRALEIENASRFLSRFFSTPKAKRPLETEIADCKESIVSFLKRRGVREVNEYGWILLKGIFREQWSAGNGRDQIEAFRQIPRPYRGQTRTRADVERIIEKAKVDLFKMEDAAKKSTR